ncbi:MAG TPA: dihydroorotate dehydrogenase [Candidatus Limnocylindrales bacterium]|nr:dihydroorotate dehydrogenase [Candidatus Limnocylindrales bacterium]
MSVRPDLSLDIGSLHLANPVMPASGCFGPELGDLIDLDRLGALVTKTIFFDRRSGNPADRLTETGGVMLNSVGIPSPGIDGFLTSVLPRYVASSPPTIVSIGGLTIGEYERVAARLDGVSGIAAIEVNISCPNLEAGGLEIGSDPMAVEAVVRSVVARTSVPIIAKLTPNVTSIVEIAQAAEAGGATAVSAINTLLGLGVSLEARRPLLGNGAGGVSGPAIKPVALRMVSEVAQAVRIPVIGVGGIATARDALQFLAVGAAAVQVGTATFTHPDSMLRVIDGIEAWMRERGLHSLGQITATIGKRAPERADVAASALPRIRATALEAPMGHP